eukprot:Blabericola_migrator_1__13392@NODE_955_length_5901_cov_91_229345_g663_i0_p5_GENE_NODE_955_length_5901_cov_91_229345_g663_i0NODE_955_length_5901_cov_91_229345_g663_i0_p5_ORF_typecomplete_len231_score38_91_NODE_955_length_5901_cov_91_229345_g663_i025793271
MLPGVGNINGRHGVQKKASKKMEQLKDCLLDKQSRLDEPLEHAHPKQTSSELADFLCEWRGAKGPADSDQDSDILPRRRRRREDEDFTAEKLVLARFQKDEEGPGRRSPPVRASDDHVSVTSEGDAVVTEKPEGTSRHSSDPRHMSETSIIHNPSLIDRHNSPWLTDAGIPTSIHELSESDSSAGHLQSPTPGGLTDAATPSDHQRLVLYHDLTEHESKVPLTVRRVRRG